MIKWRQEIIRVREGIVHIFSLTKVIPLKLFLGIYGAQFLRGSYSRDAWTSEATLTKLPETIWRNVIAYVLIAKMLFSALSAVFLFDRAFVCLCSFGSLLFGRLFGIAKISQTSPIVVNMPTRELLAGETKNLLFNVFNI